MPSVMWNSDLWGTAYAWPESGEEWSWSWGGSEAQWFGCLYPRLHRHLPAGRILEIAPGHGRWTRYLIPACSEYVGIDLNESCTQICRTRFGAFPQAKFLSNDGYSLDHAEDEKYDLVFSFDSLVHAEMDVFESYIPQIIRKLTPKGIAFIHHSNLADAGLVDGQPTHSRAMSVSAGTVSAAIGNNRGVVVLQEIISWIDTGLTDCLTTFGRADAFGHITPTRLTNPLFPHEAALIKTYQAPYSGLPARE